MIRVDRALSDSQTSATVACLVDAVARRVSAGQAYYAFLFSLVYC